VIKFRNRHNFDLLLLLCTRGTRLVGPNLQPTCIAASKTTNDGAESLHGTHCVALTKSELFNDKRPVPMEDTVAHCLKAVRTTGQGAIVNKSTTSMQQNGNTVTGIVPSGRPCSSTRCCTLAGNPILHTLFPIIRANMSLLLHLDIKWLKNK